MLNKWLSVKIAPRLVIFSLFCIVPLLLLGGSYFYAVMHKQVLHQIDGSLKNDLEIVKYHLKQETEHISLSTQIIASDPGLRKALDRGISLGLNAQLNRIARIYPNLNYLLLLDIDNRIFAINTIDDKKRKLKSENVLGQKIVKSTIMPLLNTESNNGSIAIDPYLIELNLPTEFSQWFSAPVLIRGEIKGWIILSYRWASSMTVLEEELITQLNSVEFPIIGSAITSQQGGILAGSLVNEGQYLEQVTEFIIADEPYQLVMQVDKDIALEALNKQKTLIITVVIPLLLILMLVLYFLVNNQLIKRIKMLDENTRVIAKGNLSQRIELTGNDELAQLGRSFDGMRKKLQASHVNFESKVKSRTQELRESNEKLELAVQEAIVANDIKSEFLASMSHEIRTPMNGVLGMLSLLDNTTQSNEQHHFTDMATKSAKSLLGLINDILDFSKIEAGKLDIEAIDFNIEDLFKEFIETVSFKVDYKLTELLLDLDIADNVHVKGDPGRIKQILINLVGNAIKFTSTGEIIITAKIEEDVEPDKLKLICSISDTGIGIEPHKISSLFEVFTQVDSSTTRKYGGTGLGLTIVKQLCELMHGCIFVESTINVGSKFTFEVLFGKTQQPEIVTPPLNLKNKTLLIVDDNKMCREIFFGQLKSYGMVITEAADAAEAMAIMNSNTKYPFDAAILDMQMPNINGEDLAKLIRDNPVFDSTKLILCTSMTNRGDAKKMADIGFQGYFPKPTTGSDLRDALNMVINSPNNQLEPLLTRHNLRNACDIQPKLSGHILLVEDNRINQVVARKMLEQLSLQVTVANNGQEAIHLLTKSETFSLVIMDCQMPVLDGYQATKKIRNGEAGDNNMEITIVAMTANAMAGDKDKCLLAGMDDYLSKPIEQDKLVIKLSHYLS
jgi:signal transduction histidine kinase/DNA-binding response OmpR family regulator